MRLGLVWVVMAATAAHGETGRDAWLRYAPLEGQAGAQYRQTLPAVVSVLDDRSLEASARGELVRGVRGMIGRTLREESGIPKENAIVVGTLEEFRRAAPDWRLDGQIPADGFWLKTVAAGGARYTAIMGGSERGALYGAFALLRKIALEEPVDALDERQAPYAPARWVNQWDDLNGLVERGYGGRSIFWDNGHVRQDQGRVGEYARLLASLGINACSINNVNANPHLLTAEYLPEVARIAAAMRPWGVQTVLSVDLGSPMSVGGLDTFDPRDEHVAAWWKKAVDGVYDAVPDLAGFVLKADSEGRVGPSKYGRTQADAANVVARALAPHGGLLFYRGFVYDNHMDWRNPKNDRAKAAYDNFHDLDGKFEINALIQIKNGPIDFQVREPESPLFGALEKTNEAIELQVTQEYFGQAQHTVFLVPQWKHTLDFDMRAKAGEATPVKALAAGKTFGRPAGGFVGVVNVGLDENWVGNHLSQANLYGFGRLAWNPNLSSEQIVNEWTRLTFRNEPHVVETIGAIQLSSWRTYEDYTGPLGLQTLTDIVGDHYGVNVEASERNGWGQWHRADEQGVGMDRTAATGTGFVGQYRPEVARVYESLASCPDELLLFLHHVPYTYKLHEGRTVLQYIYDSHYQGAEAVARYVRQWKTLEHLIDDDRYRAVLAQLEYQAGQAVVWRDAVNMWFFKESGIADAGGRVGHFPDRYEAEAMKLEGYTVRDVTPWEDASRGKAVACEAARCVASLKFAGEPGWYQLRVQYFDQANGTAHFRVRVGAQVVDEWAADLALRLSRPAVNLDSTTATRRVIHGIALRPGDEIRVEGTPEGKDLAAVDYLEIEAEGK